MKSLNVFDALFIMLLFMKATDAPFFGKDVTWLMVAAPYLTGVAVNIVGAVIKTSGIWKRFEFWLWKFQLKQKLDKITREATRTANPGQFQNPENFGK